MLVPAAIAQQQWITLQQRIQFAMDPAQCRHLVSKERSASAAMIAANRDYYRCTMFAAGSTCNTRRERMQVAGAAQDETLKEFSASAACDIDFAKYEKARQAALDKQRQFYESHQ